MRTLILLIMLIPFFSSPEPTGAANVAPTLSARSGAGAAIAKGHAYLIGGINGSTFLQSMEYAPLLKDGGIGAWKEGPRMNMERGFTTAAFSGGWVYLLGGANGKNGINLLATVERAKLNADGSLGPWILEPKLMQTSRRGTVAVAHNNHLYAMGGYSGIFLSTVERARINPDGSLGPWIYEPNEMNDARYIHGAAIHGNTLYVVGGHNEATGGALNSVEYCTINPDGSVGPWRRTSPLNEARYLTTSTVVGDYLYVFGGFNGKTYMQTVEKAKINKDGTLGPWQKTASLSVPREGVATTVNGNNIYLIGGSNSSGYLTSTEHGKVGAEGNVAQWISSPPSTGRVKIIKPQGTEKAATQTSAGLQLMNRGKIDEAIIAFQSAIKADGNYAEAYFYLGIAWLQKSKPRDAIEALEVGVKLADNHADMQYNLACAYARDKQVKKGIKSLTKALSLGFDPAFAHKDPDLSNLRKDPDFDALFSGERKKKPLKK
ncbi:MAG: hypothetical protein OEV28_12985 [Nitrospirota bacterium]|nr:hypothetical protein [Nitrospirota bacterium]